MKSFFFLLLSLCLWCSGCASRGNIQTVSKMVGEYINKNCEDNKPCKIKIKDATNFSWDRLYVFDIDAEDNVISEIVGIEYSSKLSGYSRKWIFVKDKQIVYAAEHTIYEVDKPVRNGDVLLNEEHPKEKYSIFNQDSLFEVSKNKLDKNEHYFYLTCVNCVQPQ